FEELETLADSFFYENTALSSLVSNKIGDEGIKAFAKILEDVKAFAE
ncbi:28230_t:CDS:2, partial [Dentiscutata erythropus]